MGASEQDDVGFLREVARDPDGNEFFLQATRAFGMAGPVLIGTDSHPFGGGGLLRFMNRLLLRVQRPMSIESVMVLVYRDGADDEPVLIEDVGTMAEARSRLASIAEQVRCGTFRP